MAKNACGLRVLRHNKWAITALEGAIWRGYDLGEMLLPCGTLLGIGLVCYSAGVAVLSRQRLERVVSVRVCSGVRGARC